MKTNEMISGAPIPVEKSVRAEEVRVLTTGRGGKILPIACVPLLREDRAKGSIRLKLEMAETVHPLMNAINVTAFAHLVPFSAFERFKGMDDFNRSYTGATVDGITDPDFIQTKPFYKAHAFWKTLGIHWPEAVDSNAAYLEAYNLIVNFRRKSRSTKLPARSLLLGSTLAEAFWHNTGMAHIVPDFDQAMMDGAVQISMAAYSAPVDGLGIRGTATATAGTYTQTDGTTFSGAFPTSSSDGGIRLKDSGGGVMVPDVTADISARSGSFYLSDIDTAKQTVAFAKLRERYAGFPDEHLVDLLMEGIRIPEELLKQPILLDRKSTIFGYSERHAMDGANLDKSVTTGTTDLTLNFNTPAVNTGGVIVVTVEIVPEQLFERQKDVYMGITEPDQFPNFLRDYLDPEKVDVVQNDYVDVLHSQPLGTFGYAPLNHAWKRSITRIGGRYYRPVPDTFVEDRQRFWSVEKIDPTLKSDFYLVPADLPHTVFADSVADPFEILALGRVEIVGNTVFGQSLDEDRNDYDKVAAVVDGTRIVQG